MTSETSVRGLHCAEVAYPRGMRFPAHAHELSSVTVVASGGVVEYDHAGRPAACERGMVIVRPEGDVHANQVGGDGVVNVEVDLTPAVLAEHGARITEPRIIAPAVATGLAVRLRRALGSSDAARSLLVESLALELVAVALYEPENRSPSTLRHAHERIQQEFREKLTMAELAREAGMHPVSFARAFRVRYRVSPGELVRRLRVEWAAGELLRRPEEPIAHIAVDAGFYDQSHFARAFTARFGRPPARYRADR